MMADIREWRGLPKRGKRLRNLEEIPVRKTWHGANAPAKQRKYRRRRTSLAIRETVTTACLAITAGLTFAVFDTGSLQHLRRSVLTSLPQSTASSQPQTIFGHCHIGGGTNCVVDGDTFWMDGQKIRIADIDTPETHPPRCPEEAALGEQATQRLRALLNEGPITLETTDRSTDQYGRALRIVKRNGQSLGAILVTEGLARPWEGYRRPWCG
jgi:micrococcal nuclease